MMHTETHFRPRMLGLGYIACLSIFYISVCRGQQCEPCEENSFCTFSYTIANNKHEQLYWNYNSKDIAVCNFISDIGCDVFKPYDQYLKTQFKLEPGELTVNLTLIHPNRQNSLISSGKELKLYAYPENQQLKLLYTCTIQFFRRIENLECNHLEVDFRLNISCTSTNIFPEGSCKFELKSNNDRILSGRIPEYNHLVTSQHPKLYTSQCYITVPMQDLSPGILDYTVLMYQYSLNYTRNCTACNTLKTAYYTINLASNKSECSSENPHNCSNQCYNNEQFCLQGVVHHCNDSQPKKLKEWCHIRTDEYINNNQSCRTECQNLHTDSQNDTNHLNLFLYIGIPTVIVVLGLIIIFILKRRCICQAIFGKIRRSTYDTRNDYNTIPLLEQSRQEQTQLPRTLSAAQKSEKLEICHTKSVLNGMIPVTEYMLNNAEHLKTILRVVDSTIDSVHKYIVSCIKLTVKITVDSPSSNRFGSYETFFKSNGQNKPLYGNGIVVKVKKSERECKCSDQVQKPHPTWCLFIATSRFVVFDNLEAENATKVDITFHGLIGSVKTINVEKIYQYNSDETCIVMGYTCDETICKELRDSLQVQKDTYKILEYAENKVVVISHPHGMEKHISFGSCSENEQNLKSDSIFILNQLQYDAPLCDGCAGAPVIKLNDSFTKRHSTHIMAEFLLHTFSQSEGNGISGWARIPMTVAEYLHESFYVGFEINSSNDEIQKDGKKLKLGPGGLEILYDDDIQSKKSSCKKSPSHEHFHPVNSFKELNLPVASEKRSLVDSCIQTVSELSGRIAVNYTSHDRPDIDPVTQATFSSCDLKGTKCLRYGSGTIVSLVHSDHADFTCTCANCIVLKSTVKKSYCVYVQTANHVVFDSSEACESSFRIGFDDDASPEVLLHGLRVVESDINTGRSLVLYVTHDVELGIKLSEKISYLYSLDRQLYLKFKRSDDVNLAVIVSHPHGSCKRVSFGKWLKKQTSSSPCEMNNFIRFIYDTPTCPGSSGGAVLIVGGSIPHVTKRLIPPHLHRETSGDGKSTSCFEVVRFSSNE